MLRPIISACLFVGVCLVVVPQANAQFTTFRPTTYLNTWSGARLNPLTQSTHLPGQAVVKPSGVYQAVGNGYYHNQFTGNVYNPYTGSYSAGRHVTFRPQTYANFGNGTRFNPLTGSAHLPGRAVVKPSGVYRPVGNGYYRNPFSGNIYNPYTGVYKR